MDPLGRVAISTTCARVCGNGIAVSISVPTFHGVISTGRAILTGWADTPCHSTAVLRTADLEAVHCGFLPCNVTRVARALLRAIQHPAIVRTAFFVVRAAFFIFGAALFIVGATFFVIGSAFFVVGAASFAVGAAFFIVGAAFFTVGAAFFTVQSKPLWELQWTPPWKPQ